MKTIIASIVRLTVGAFFALSLASVTRAQQLPTDLVGIATNQIPRNSGLYSIANWPWPPYPPGCWTFYAAQGVQFYYSPSLGTNSVFMDDRELVAMQTALRLARRAAANDGPPPVPGGDGGDSGDDSGSGTNYSARAYTTNDFWLEAAMTNASLNLLVHTPNPESFFDLFWAPAVPVTNGWWWIARGLPGQLAFNISLTNLSGDMGFFAAGTTNGMDAQGITDAYRALVGGINTLTNDLDQDGLPDCWEIKYFGDLSQSAANDFDGDGVLNGAEFAQGTDPNKLSFLTFFTNDHINGDSVSGTIQTQTGVPAQMAILVNSTNWLSAVWLPFSPNFTATLPSADGAYDVWVGLRGRAPDSMQTWLAATIWRDTAAPLLFITNPLTNIDSRPLIQIKGYSPEPITLAFNVTNALGEVRQGTGLLVGQLYDTNTLDLSTCSFECLDIHLALGTNYVGLSATDRAGNLTQTNLLYVFDTNGTIAAPVITVTWPRDGAKLSANTDSFTLLGRLDDETASVVGQIVSPDGTTNTLNALVERNGKFWVQGLSLAAGTNLVSVAAINAAGKLSTTNLTVVKSDVVLTIYAVPEDQLYLATVTVQGSVTGPTNAVWVNGVQADVDSGTGVWTATNVPVTSGGAAVFTATAYPPDEAPSGNSGGQGCNLTTANSCDQTLIEDKPPRVYVQHYDLAYSSQVGEYTCLRLVPVKENLTRNWTKDACGATQTSDWLMGLGSPTEVDPANLVITWPADTYPPTLPGSATAFGAPWPGQFDPPSLPMEQCNIKGTGYFYNLTDLKIESAQYTRAAKTVVMLFTGGKEGIEKVRLHELDVSLFSRAFKWWFGGGGSLDLSDIAPGATAGVFGEVGPDDKAYQLLADGKDVVVTPEKTGVANQGGGLPGHKEYTLKIYRNGDITDKTSTVYVGEQMILSCFLDPMGGPPITNYQWTIPGTYVGGYLHSSMLGENVPAALTNTNGVVIYYWVDKLDAGDVTCKVKAAGKEWSAKTTFNVLKPTADWTGQSCGVFSFEPDGMYFEDVLNFIDGMTFTFTNKNLMGYTNTHAFKSAQVGSMQVTFEGTNSSGAAKTVTLAGQGLDGPFPYKDFGSAAGGNAVDSPGGPIGPSETNSPLVYISSATYSGQFDHYLFFQPGGASFIPVAVKRVGWQFSMKAINSGASSAPDTLELSNCTATVTANNVPVTGNPQWTNNLRYLIKTVTP